MISFLLRGGVERFLPRDSPCVRALIDESPVIRDLINDDDDDQEDGDQDAIVPLPACGAEEFDLIVEYVRANKTLPAELFRHKRKLLDVLRLADTYALDEMGLKAAELFVTFDGTWDFDETVRLVDALLTALIAKEKVEATEPTMTEGMGWMRKYETDIKKRTKPAKE